MEISQTEGRITMEKNDNREERMGKGRLFERIRRITGYLTGDMRTWNDAKRAEEKDRVKHGLGGGKKE